MSDPFIPLGRLFMLIFVPVSLLFPIVFAALVPNRAADDSARIKARGMLLTLAMSTVVLLAIWVGLVQRLIGRIMSTEHPRNTDYRRRGRPHGHAARRRC